MWYNAVMSAERVLGLDIDDVCADFMTHFIYLHGMPARWGVYNIFNLYPHIGDRKMRKLLKDPESYADLLPVPGAPQGVKKIKQLGFVIHYITSRPKELEELTLTWLRNFHFPSYSNLTLTAGHDEKVNYLSENHLWGLVEDRGQTLLQAEKYVTHRYLFDRPWNRGYSSLPRHISWNHLTDSIARDADLD